MWRVCHDQRWWSNFCLRRSSYGRRPDPPVHDDQVRRDFTAEAANRLRLTDITEHRTAEGKVYLCAVKDVSSNRIVGYSISDRMKARLAVDALTAAVACRAVNGDDVAGCIVHSDGGSQFRFLQASGFVTDVPDWQTAHHDLARSMRQVGSAGDNAAMERATPARKRPRLVAVSQRLGTEVGM